MRLAIALVHRLLVIKRKRIKIDKKQQQNDRHGPSSNAKVARAKRQLPLTLTYIQLIVIFHLGMFGRIDCIILMVTSNSLQSLFAPCTNAIVGNVCHRHSGHFECMRFCVELMRPGRDRICEHTHSYDGGYRVA